MVLWEVAARDLDPVALRQETSAYTIPHSDTLQLQQQNFFLLNIILFYFAGSLQGQRVDMRERVGEWARGARYETHKKTTKS